jgi:hypothetical protein
VEGIADDTTLGAAVGVGDVISTDDLGTKKVQRVKVQHGADGSATDASTASPLPVDQTNTTVADGGALPAKGVQVGGTDGSVFQVLSTDAAGRLNTNVNGTVPVSGTVTSTLSATTNAGATAKTSDYDTGAGTDTVTSFGIALPASGGAVQGGTATNPVRTDPTGTTTQPVSGTVTATGPLTDTQLRASAVPVSLASAPSTAVTNAGTFAVQDSQKVVDNAGFTDGTTPVNPVGYIFDEVAGTALTENDAAAARIDSKRAQVLVIEDSSTRGQRATVSAAGAVKVDGSAVTQPVSGTVTANLSSAAVTNAGTFAVQDSEKVADNAGFTDGTTKVNPVGFIFDEVAGTALTENDVGAGRMDSKRAQVLTLEDATTRGQRATVSAAGAVKVDGSAVTQPASLASLPALAAGSALVGRVNLDPQTANGLSIFHLVSAATTNATNVKASAGQVYGWYVYNSNAAARKLVFHNNAGSPTAGAGVIFSVVIPPTSAANVFSEMGLAFSTGIAITTVTDLTDAGTTAVAASDLIINVFYK